MSTTLKFIAASLLSLSAYTQAHAFTLESNLKANQPIPAEYYWNTFGCTGASQSPTLEWKDVPEGTKSFAITFYDADAPTGSGFWHYVAYDIPVSTRKIELGALSAAKLPSGAKEGNTDLGKPGFFGPCPPVGRKHNYTYTVHALKVEKLDVPANATAAFIGFNLWTNTLGKASFTVTAGPRTK
jgi:Raf kinase inhibitor-like YbhB/YbcL family protein